MYNEYIRIKGTIILLTEDIADIKKPPIEYILLCCCSCKRPLMLKNALLSINELKFPENIRIELLVVDNDEYRSAEGIVKKLEPDIKCPVHYAEESRRGLAFARNKVLDEAVRLGASHIMLFDDDELFDKDCLIQHVDLYNSNPKAMIVSGLQLNTFSPDCPEYISNSIVFKLKTSRKKGKVKSSCATNNVFFPVSLVKDHNFYSYPHVMLSPLFLPETFNFRFIVAVPPQFSENFSFKE